MCGINAGNFQYSVCPCQHWVTENAGMETRDSRKVTLENPKPTRVTEFNV